MTRQHPHYVSALKSSSRHMGKNIMHTARTVLFALARQNMLAMCSVSVFAYAYVCVREYICTFVLVCLCVRACACVTQNKTSLVRQGNNTHYNNLHTWSRCCRCHWFYRNQTPCMETEFFVRPSTAADRRRSRRRRRRTFSAVFRRLRVSSPRAHVHYIFHPSSPGYVLIIQWLERALPAIAYCVI